SQDVTVAPGAIIAADATVKGNGGRITILSADQTVMDGLISARGGPEGGDGGFTEVSGRTLGFDGEVNLGAPVGKVGTLVRSGNAGHRQRRQRLRRPRRDRRSG
ncbi:MAG: hypothetical protein ACRDNS_30370, partial [Trebonia sp.]